MVFKNAGPKTFHRRKSLGRNPSWVTVRKLICQKHVLLLLKEMKNLFQYKIDYVIIICGTYVY